GRAAARGGPGVARLAGGQVRAGAVAAAARRARGPAAAGAPAPQGGPGAGPVDRPFRPRGGRLAGHRGEGERGPPRGPRRFADGEAVVAPAAGAGRPGTRDMHRWQLAGRTLEIGERPLVMGIVNAPPASFSAGGRFATTELAVAHGLELAAQGADLLDIGGESTRPGATPVPPEEELRRVLPVVEALARRTPLPLSVDTSQAEGGRPCPGRGARVGDALAPPS